MSKNRYSWKATTILNYYTVYVTLRSIPVVMGKEIFISIGSQIALKIGVISDTHDDIQFTKKAVGIFNTLEVDYVFHAGDYIYPGMIALFGELNKNIKFYGVRGNNDGELTG